MAGKNAGQTYIETFGTSSPVTGSAPTDPTDGQPLAGLGAITLVASAAVGATLSGAGNLLAYIFDDSLAPPPARGDAASSTGTTIVLNESALTDGFVVGMTVTGLTSGVTGIVTAIGGSGNKTLTCSGGVTGTALAHEVILGIAPGRWARLPTADFPVTLSSVRDQAFDPVLVETPRTGRIKWIPSGVTFNTGTGGVTLTQMGQTNAQLQTQGKWGG